MSPASGSSGREGNSTESSRQRAGWDHTLCGAGLYALHSALAGLSQQASWWLVSSRHPLTICRINGRTRETSMSWAHQLRACGGNTLPAQVEQPLHRHPGCTWASSAFWNTTHTTEARESAPWLHLQESWGLIVKVTIKHQIATYYACLSNFSFSDVGCFKLALVGIFTVEISKSHKSRV